jgi:ABC-type branched-subunit amino acid transport system substrate-binding protein
VNPAVQNTGAYVELIKALEATKSSGITKPSDIKLAIAGLASAAGTFVTKTLTTAAKAAGITVVYAVANMPITATNYAPFAQAIIASGANLAYPVVSELQVIDLAGALKQAGYKGAFTDGSVYLPGSLTSQEESALTGAYLSNPIPIDEDKTAGIKTALKQLKEAGFKPLLTGGVPYGYWTATMLISLMQATAKRVGAAKVNSVTMKATVAKGWTWMGSMWDEKFPKAYTDPLGCYQIAKGEGQAYKLVVPWHCYPTNIVSTGL